MGTFSAKRARARPPRPTKIAVMLSQALLGHGSLRGNQKNCDRKEDMGPILCQPIRRKALRTDTAYNPQPFGIHQRQSSRRNQRADADSRENDQNTSEEPNPERPVLPEMPTDQDSRPGNAING